MRIKWFGQSFFVVRIKRGKKVLRIAIDPYEKKIGLEPPKVEAQILLITHDHFDHSNESAVKGDPFVIKEPGEYETKKVLVKGIHSFHDEKEGSDRGVNVIYKFKAEGMNLCHLGDLGQKELSPEQLEEIGEVDILMIPVGGKYTIDGKQATEIVSQIEPRIVIPMHYKMKGLKVDIDSEEKFLKNMGAEDVSAEEKLEVSQSKLPEEGETEIVLLKKSS